MILRSLKEQLKTFKNVFNEIEIGINKRGSATRWWLFLTFFIFTGVVFIEIPLYLQNQSIVSSETLYVQQRHQIKGRINFISPTDYTNLIIVVKSCKEIVSVQFLLSSDTTFTCSVLNRRMDRFSSPHSNYWPSYLFKYKFIANVIDKIKPRTLLQTST